MLTPFQKKKGNTEKAKTFISIKSTYSVIKTQISVPATVEGGCQSVGGLSWETCCVFLSVFFLLSVFCDFFLFVCF